MSKVAQEQIDNWKKKHGEIFKLEFEDGKEAYLKKPDRKIMSYAMTKCKAIH